MEKTVKGFIAEIAHYGVLTVALVVYMLNAYPKLSVWGFVIGTFLLLFVVDVILHFAMKQLKLTKG